MAITTVPCVKLATRRSPLALWQAEWVQTLLKQQGIHSELLPLTTSGDRLQGQPLATYHAPTAQTPHHLTTGKGLFVKEIQEALLRREAHIAVHSLKDLPAVQTPGLMWGAVLPRHSPNDVLICSPRLWAALEAQQHSGGTTPCWEQLHGSMPHHLELFDQPCGTTSARRLCLLRELVHPHIPCHTLRGNVGSRLKKVEAGDFSAIILAQAGLERLGLYPGPRMIPLPIDPWLPAPGQGLIALEWLTDPMPVTPTWVRTVCHPHTTKAAVLERLVLHLLDGDCHSAVGAFYEEPNLSVLWQAPAAAHVRRATVHLSEADRDELQKCYERADGLCAVLFGLCLKSKLCDKIRSFFFAQGFLSSS